MRKASIAAMCLFLLSGSPVAQLANESEISRILKGSGALLLREGHELENLTTIEGESISAEIVILKNLAHVSAEVTVGLRLSAEEEYGTKSVYLDVDEIDGVLTSLELIQREGKETLSNYAVDPSEFLGSSSEIQYTTKERLKFAVFINARGLMRWGIRLPTASEWLLLSDAGVTTLIKHLKKTLELEKVASSGQKYSAEAHVYTPKPSNAPAVLMYSQGGRCWAHALPRRVTPFWADTNKSEKVGSLDGWSPVAILESTELFHRVWDSESDKEGWVEISAIAKIERRNTKTFATCN